MSAAGQDAGVFSALIGRSGESGQFFGVEYLEEPEMSEVANGDARCRERR